MSEFDPVVTDDSPPPPPQRVIVGPFQMTLAGAKVQLSFENGQYAEAFVERHKCRAINALDSSWEFYRTGRTTDPINCPLCSKPAVVTSETDITSSDPADHYERAVTIGCDDCGISLTEEYRHEAVERWNSRGCDVPDHKDRDDD